MGARHEMPESSVPSPRQVIERVRRTFLVDDDLPENLREGALNLQTQLNNALKLLSEDLYSKKSHFILELVQNSDDNDYGDGVTPELTLLVTPNRLVLSNNELGFTENNISAICNVGASSKAKDKQSHIGEKGIGFKSVFSVSNAPEIHSNGYHFRFDRTDTKNLLGYVIPTWCEPSKEACPGYTTIVLPAAPGYTFNDSTIAELDARILLFLNKLRQLTLTSLDIRHLYRRQDEIDFCLLTTETSSLSAEVVTEELRYLRVSKSYSMTGPYEDPKRPDVFESKLVLAFPLDSDGAAKPEPGSHIFAYLPVQQVGFKFPIHGDFVLSSGRETILNDRPWNLRLRDAIAETFVSALTDFRKTSALGLSYLRFVPSESDVVDDFFGKVRTRIIESLSVVESLPSASGAWCKPSDLRTAERGFRALFTSEHALRLFGFDYVDLQIQGGVSLLRELGVREAGRAEVLELFEVHGLWLAAQPLEWRARLYAYIATDIQSFINAGLLKTACLPTSSGIYVIPASTQVFFPLGKKKKFGFESELTIIDSELFEAAQELSSNVEYLFEMMNVRNDDPYDLVVGHILPRHKGESWTNSTNEALIGHLRYIKEKLDTFLEQAISKGKSEDEACKLLRDGIWVGTKLVNESGSWIFNRVGDLYLGKEYKPDFCIETLTEGNMDASQFVSDDYLAKKPKDPDAEAQSWREFFVSLGIRTSPALESVGSDWKCSDELKLLLFTSKPATRRATLECLSKHWAEYSSRLSYLLQSRKYYATKINTTFASEIRSMPAPLKGKRESVPLSECYYQTEEIRAILGDSSPYLDALLVESMLDACEVTHRLDANTLIKRLKQLKQSQSGTAKQVQAIYRALEGRTWESGEDLIRKSFEDDGLIRLTGAHKGWFSPSEVAWQSNGHFLDSLYPPIQANYKDFQGFFIDKLKVPRVLPLEKWVEALAHLDQISDQSEREAEALAIYKRAEKGLKPLFGREVQPPNWIETFKDEAVYIDHRGELVANYDGLYANDAPWLADLFRDEEGLSLLAVPSDEIPRLNRLLTASGVARLSQAASVEVEKIDDGNLDNELTLRLQKAVPYFARILYSRFPSEFESAMENGALNALWELQVIEVPEVKLQVELGNFHCKATIDAALSHGRIYYRVGVRSLKDRVAAELSKHLVGTTNLADTYARVLMEPDDEGIEEFLLVSSIGQLPADLENAVQQRQLLGTDDTENSEAEAFEGDSSIDDIQDEFQDDVRTTTQIVQQSEPESVTDGHATSVESNRSIDVPHSEQGESSQHSNPSSTSVSHERREPSAAPSVESIATTTRKFSPRNKAAENATDNSLPPANSKQGETPNPGASTITGKFHRTSTARNSPARSRSGRLLSYVETTDNTDRVTLENDATRAAARDATSKAAVAHVLRSLAGRWASMTEMPHNNKGFDILAKTAEGVEEYIEVKGQSGAWTHEGVALTPMELLMAHEQDGHYCLCVVEFAQDDKRRQIHLVRNPFSLVSQFRFDVGWKGAAETITSAPSVPEKGMYIDIADVGVGRIISAKRKGEFYRVHVILQTGKQVNASFHPAKMTLSLEPLWQE